LIVIPAVYGLIKGWRLPLKRGSNLEEDGVIASAVRAKAMGFYRDQIVPLLINLSMRQKKLVAYRDRIVPAASGRVLEIGIGSGLNLGGIYIISINVIANLMPTRRSIPQNTILISRQASPSSTPRRISRSPQGS
jgi:hypothetical protein